MKIVTVFFLLLTCVFFRAPGQGTCPPNIGFDSGNFQNWECLAYSRDAAGALTFVNNVPLPDRHRLIGPGSNGLDKYGRFPVHAPGSGGYSLLLGNESDGAQAERVAYTFTIPAGTESYTVIYQYATVAAYESVEEGEERPSFSVGVFDVTDGQYIACAASKVYPSPSEPGMLKSAMGLNVYYRDWTKASIDLSGYAGKTLRLEFTTADCYYDYPTAGHFGYAYLDVTENCGQPVTGNQYCNPESATLTGPPGYKDYHWFDDASGALLGDESVIELRPAPLPGTRFRLETTPFPGISCNATFYTVIQNGIPVTDFRLKERLTICSGTIADLSDPSLTSGNAPGLLFSYYSDAGATTELENYNAVTEPGTYYVKASNATGCSLVKPIEVIFLPSDLLINDPPVGYLPFVVDITSPDVTRGSSEGFTYSYWKNPAASDPLLSPATITVSGTYYIKASKGDCEKIAPVRVSVRSTIPDTFTPNGDGVNDLFHVANPSDKVNFRIYNRWGDLVFSNRRSGNTWDGNSNGIKQPAGTYYWILETIDPKTKQPTVFRGAITLIR